MAKHLKTKQGKKGIWIAVLLVSAALLIAALVFLLPQLLPAPEDKTGVAAETALPSETEAKGSIRRRVPRTMSPKNPIIII